MSEIAELVGKTLREVRNENDERLIFVTSDEAEYVLLHHSDCCESVSIEDITGELSDLVGSPIIQAEESSNQDNPKEHADSWTWTFYRLATAKGSVVIRWYGESNGYYSELVDFERIR